MNIYLNKLIFPQYSKLIFKNWNTFSYYSKLNLAVAPGQSTFYAKDLEITEAKTKKPLPDWNKI